MPLPSLDTALSPKKAAQFSGLLWGIAAGMGVLVVVLPHGATVDPIGLVALTIFASMVSAWSFWKGTHQPLSAQYVLSVLALVAVSVAVVCGHRSPVVFAIAGLYVLPSIYTASFYPSRVFIVYLVAQAAVSGAALLTSGVSGAAAGWIVVVGTCSTVGIVVHLLQQALKLAATTDPLTGLVNRRALEPLLEMELARCARFGHTLSLVVLDLDFFKEINDEYGHQQGDLVLTEVARAWSFQLRKTDLLARAGGDEFVLVLPSTDRAQALEVLARLSAANEQPFSAGVAVAAPGTAVEDAMREADDACYLAKQAGRGQIVVAELTAA